MSQSQMPDQVQAQAQAQAQDNIAPHPQPTPTMRQQQEEMQRPTQRLQVSVEDAGDPWQTQALRLEISLLEAEYSTLQQDQHVAQSQAQPQQQQEQDQDVQLQQQQCQQQQAIPRDQALQMPEIEGEYPRNVRSIQDCTLQG